MKIRNAIARLSLVLLAAAGARGQVANDQCLTAELVTDGAPAAADDNAPAALADDGEAGCQPDSSHDVWFEYVATCNGNVTVDTLDSGQLDTVLSAYDGCGGAELACNDDFDDSLRSQMRFSATLGTSYWIRLASYADPGPYQLNIACRVAPPNDICSNALNIRAGIPAVGNNAGAAPLDDAAASCRPGADHDVWFSYLARCAGPVTLDTFGSSQGDPVLSVYDACGGTEMACNDDAVGGDSLQAELTFTPVFMQRYWVRLASLGEAGDYQLNVTCHAPPANDDCADAEPLGDGNPAAEGDSSTADALADGTASCAPQASHDVWYTYTATCDGVATIDTLGSAMTDPVLSVYDGCGGAELVCSDDNGDDLRPVVEFVTTSGHAYAVRVACNGTPGAFQLNVRCDGTPANDACASAALVTDGAPAVTADNTRAADPDDAEADCAAASDGDLWFEYIATCDGTVRMATTNASVDTVLSVYDACGGNTVVCNDDTGESTLSAVAFSASAGTSYWIRVASLVGRGRFDLNIACGGAPANDACDNPQAVVDGPNPVSNLKATTDGPDPGAGGRCDFGAGTDVASDVWFCYLASCNGIATFDLCAAEYDSKVAVYRGCSCPSEDPAVCNDDACDGTGSRVSMPVEQGEDLLVRVGGFLGAQGLGSLVISCEEVGACCSPEGCSIVPAHECSDDEQTFMGGGTNCAGDDDGDGIVNMCDRCAQSDLGVPLDFTGCQRGDFDLSGAVDAADYRQFLDCMAGPNVLPAPAAPVTPADCLQAFDGTEDGDVDLEDLRRLLRNFGD